MEKTPCQSKRGAAGGVFENTVFPLKVTGWREGGTDRLGTTLNPYFCPATRER
jgi:hypothetical protein